MGWLYQQDPVDDPVTEIVAKFSYRGDPYKQRVLEAARVGNTIYLAVKVTDAGTTFVTAFVVLISNTRRHGFGYKDMDETMGPVECACPDRIMRLLSPVEQLPYPGYAASWRARVQARSTKPTANDRFPPGG